MSVGKKSQPIIGFLRNNLTFFVLAANHVQFFLIFCNYCKGPVSWQNSGFDVYPKTRHAPRTLF